ncbi:MAG: FAD-dependent oxidoreductase [Sphingobacteriales bacterium]|uniref:NAD(P)/FAD-dependent oxidoreductase n=1 Tax=Hydrotalea flava TaxID=714549 RepID=UPI00082B8681|nr:FAD-dependent oxidoreductase [Hydrotalea flava]RTL50999.1 MAG: FAD-dependent oxidoreductase [Sphingobacteriales bacterium]
MEVDYLIVGQGIAGTMLSYYLLQQSNTVTIIDNYNPSSASNIASGVINPITGRRFVRTWMIETLMPFAVNAYRALEKELNISLIQQTNLLDFHSTPQMQLAFTNQLPTETEYLRVPENSLQWKKYFNYPFGVGETHPTWLVNLQLLIQTWRKKLSTQQLLIAEHFSIEALQIHPSYIQYQGIQAKAIIFCNGTQAVNLPYFQKLPFAPNKGEALILAIQQLPRQHIYKQGLSLVPWQSNLWWAGSSYEWSYEHANPTEIFRQKTLQQLQQWLQLPFEIKAHVAAERPATLERRPFIGMHPYFPQIGIFNGLGTKGCSLAPYFAKVFSEHLKYGQPLIPEVAIHRFHKILAP